MFEAISFLSTIPALKKGHSFHQVIVEGFTTKESLSMEIHSDLEVTINPIFTGAGSNGARIIIGIVIIVVAVYFKVNIANALGTNMGAVAVNFAIGMGMNLILGGLSGALNKPSPNTTNSRAERNNLLSADQNTAQIGTRIPIIYGKRRWFGQFISIDVDSSNYNPRDVNPDGSANLNFSYVSQQVGLYDTQIPIISRNSPPPVFITYWVAQKENPFPIDPAKSFVKSAGYNNGGDVDFIVYALGANMVSTAPLLITVAPKDGIVRSTRLDVLDATWRTNKILSLTETANLAKITRTNPTIYKLEIFNVSVLTFSEYMVVLPAGSNTERTWENMGRYDDGYLFKTVSATDVYLAIIPAKGTQPIVISQQSLFVESILAHTIPYGSFMELYNGNTVVARYSETYDRLAYSAVKFPVELTTSGYTPRITACNGQDLCVVTLYSVSTRLWSHSYVCQIIAPLIVGGEFSLQLVGSAIRANDEPTASANNTRGFWRGSRVINLPASSGVSTLIRHTTSN